MSTLNLQRKDFEIMAPVGSYESLAAAIEAGADAVYFGVEGLNMRSRSSANFTLDDLAEIVRRCHQEQVKTYLTVNTVIYDADLDYLDKIIIAAKTAGVTAIIASDIAVFNACRRHDVEIHISTQCNITNIEAVRFYANVADVMVLARELNLDQVRAIYDTIEAEDIRGPHGQRVRLEMFCHGALCMAVSGKCYLSLHQMNSSANRGACTQICRRGYEVTDLETGDKLNVDNKYIMSPKDLCTVDFLDRFLDAGVRVLKIEGRARSADYVKRVVECYDEALRAIEEGTYTPERAEQWKERLRTVFNRGFWGGYYMGARAGEWSRTYGSSATVRKVYVGKVTNYFARIGVIELQVEAAPLSVGEPVFLTGETTGVVEFVVEEIRVALKPVQEAPQGVLCSIKVPTLIRRGDKLFKTVPSDEKADRNR